MDGKRSFARWRALLHDALALASLRVHGVSNVEEVLPRPRESMLGARELSGYEIVIHCQERQYLCKYERWFIPNRLVRVYRVHASTSEDAPPALQKACDIEVTFPPLLFGWFSTLYQQQFAMQAFADLLFIRLKATMAQ